MPKNSALLNEIESVLQIYYEADEWLANDVYKERLQEMIGADQYQSSYTKKAQITSYFGFTTWEDYSNRQSRRKITEAGKRFYLAIKNNNQDAINEELMNSFETIKFGRENCGSSESNSDVEPPSVFIRATLDLDYLTYKEFAYILWSLEDRGGNYTDTIEEIKTARSGDGLSLPEAAQKYTDAKPIMILIRWGFLAEGDSLPGGSKKIIIAPEVIQKYKTRLQNLKIYNVDMDCDKPITDNNKSLTCKIRYNTGYESDKKFSRNRILFGAPGTGKSYTLNKEKDELLSNGGECERVTFHPDYSYANFVGTYKPTVLDSVNDLVLSEDKKEVLSILLDKSKIAQEKYDLLYDKFKEESLTRLPILLGLYTDESFKTKKKDGTNASGDNSVERNHGKAIRPYINLISEKRSTNEISYEYVPGPFMRTLVKALKNSKESITKPHVLVIEEINRANVAAVFGDVFQLLDRDDNNVSEYPIQTSEDMKRYLAKELGGDIDEYTEICIPDNMFIWSTMNSADQGVFPMDTAFKRRWDFTYLGIDDSENGIAGKTVELGKGSNMRIVEWNELRKAINAELSSYKVNEDKLLGPYFLSKKIVPETGSIEPTKFISTFKSKVIMYLFDDAAKQKRHTLFAGCSDTSKYSSICKEFEEKGIFIFGTNISNKFPVVDFTSNTAEDGAE